jgi:hypothetical protein
MKSTYYSVIFALLVGASALKLSSLPPPPAPDPIAGEDLVIEETDGLLAMEAEHYFKQTKTGVRQWYTTTAANVPEVTPDGDPQHVAGASGGAYLEALPDTRRSHDDTLTEGENFFPQPGMAGILSYKIHINTPGRYYVWARIYSTNGEDNGLHVGIDGQWPESGQRLQWIAKDQWVWGSKQRTEEVHIGEPYKLYLDIDQPGPHTITFSMREDGTEFDKWLMTTNREFEHPKGTGPAPRVKSGSMPSPF